MARLKLHPRTDDMDSNLAQVLGEFVFEGALLSYTATTLRVGFPDEVMVFTGRNFDFTIRNGAVVAVNGGTLTKLDYFDFGVLNISVTGLNISGPALFRALSQGQWATVHTMFFGGADVIELSENADEMRGFGGADTIRGFGGNDTLDGGSGNDLIYGGAGNDRVLGDSGHDSLYGDAGVDQIYGGSGNDQLFGGAGNDGLFGGLGNDSLRGGSGDDLMQGDEGADRLYGEAGHDRLYGGLDHDQLFGGAGNDRLYGDSGNDVLRGEAGNDQLYGGLGHDQLFGGAGHDLLQGDTGNDSLRGDAGNDTLIGGAGKDLLVGGVGKDVLTGGTGADVFLFAEFGTAHVDRITDFATRIDKIHLQATAFTAFDGAGVVSAGDFVLGTAARDASDHLIYQRSTGRLWYDADGSGAGAKVLIAELAANTALAATDILIV